MFYIHNHYWLHELLLNYITDMCNKKMNKHIQQIKQFVYSMYLLHRQGLLIVHTWFNSIFPSLKASSVWLYVALWSCLMEHGRMDWALIGERWKTSNYKNKTHLIHVCFRSFDKLVKSFRKYFKWLTFFSWESVIGEPNPPASCI